MHSRRQFLTTAVGASSVVTVGALPPQFLLWAAEANDAASPDTILVVVQLSGGNDGLNTVVPYADPIYRRLRPSLAIGRDAVLKTDKGLGLHPAARGLADLWEDGKLCVVQGVGYPHPNRSHFESMDIWHTCQRSDETRQTGWLGRFLDAGRREAEADSPAIHFGEEKQPLALASQKFAVPSVASLDEFRLAVNDAGKLRELMDELTDVPRPASDLLTFVQSRAKSALSTSARLQNLDVGTKPALDYPRSTLAQKLQIIARLIDAELAARIYYVTLDGFDTHSQQPDAHAALLRELGDAIAAFVEDVGARGHGHRVMVMGFSEFGRRVAENASDGTDHGAAAPMFFAGDCVHAGFIGSPPDLGDLENGDLKFRIDFRRVYAGVLEHWLHCPSIPILGQAYEPLKTVV